MLRRAIAQGGGAVRRAGTVALVLVIAVSMLGFASKPSQIPSFASVEPVDARKAAFFDFVLPMVRAENAVLLEQRARLLELDATLDSDEELAWWDRRWLDKLANTYGVEAAGKSNHERVELLKQRVDAIPPSLALAQAAKESGWGSSRFARRGNNLFGQQCFEPGCGLVPRQRSRGKRHEVRVFESVQHSVAAYLENLNTHPQYRGLRKIRAQLRSEGKPVRGVLLAEGLTHYSERGRTYVKEVKDLIHHNNLGDRSGTI